MFEVIWAFYVLGDTGSEEFEADHTKQRDEKTVNDIPPAHIPNLV